MIELKQEEPKSVPVDVRRVQVTQLLEEADNGRIQTCFEFVRFLEGESSENHLMLYVLKQSDGGEWGWYEEAIPFELHITKVMELREELERYIRWWLKKQMRIKKPNNNRNIS